MSGEKATLLPSAPDDSRIQVGPEYQQPNESGGAPIGLAAPASSLPRIVLMPGFEFDPSRKYRYGFNALSSAVFVFIAFLLVELRQCFSFGINLRLLQSLHLALFLAALTLYVLSLFGIADFLFQFKMLFLLGLIIVYGIAGLMVWMVYEAATNPCVSTTPFGFDISDFSNVFSRGDGVGIIVLLLDIFATLLMFSAGISFYKRY